MRLTPAILLVLAQTFVVPLAAEAGQGTPFSFGNVVTPDADLAATADTLLAELEKGWPPFF